MTDRRTTQPPPPATLRPSPPATQPPPPATLRRSPPSTPWPRHPRTARLVTPSMHLPGTGLPRLGLLLGAEPPAPVRALLLEIADRTRAVDGAADPDGTRPAAYLWSRDPQLPPPGAAYAVWLRDRTDATGEPARSAAALITADPDLAAETGALLVPERTAVPSARPVLPAIRRRIRAQRDLPAQVIAVGEDTTWLWVTIDLAGGMAATPLARALGETAVGVASAAAAVGRALPLALAWAAPTVTDAASAAEWGAVPGRDVLIAETYDERLAIAKDLAADEPRAAHLGWAGRRLMETRHDLRRTAISLLGALGLPTTTGGAPGGVWRDAIEAMHTPADSHARWRIGSLVAPLPARLDPTHVPQQSEDLS